MTSTFRSGAVLHTRVALPRTLSRIGKAAWVSTALLSGAALAFGGSSAEIVGVVFVLLSSLAQLVALVCFVTSYALSLQEAQSAGEITVGEAVLRVARDRAAPRDFPREAIVSALLVDRPMGGVSSPVVEVGLRDGDRLSIRAPDVPTAARLVEDLGFAGERARRVDVTLATPSRRLLGPATALGIYAVIQTSFTAVMMMVAMARAGDSNVQLLTLLSPPMILGVYQLLALALRSPRVIVGKDGVVVRRGLSRRYFPAGEVSAVERGSGASITLVDHGGRRHALSGILCDPRRADAVAAAIGRVVHTVAAVGADRIAKYGRGGDPLPAWRARIAAQVEEAGYRAAASSVEEEAEAVLASPSASADQRVGAALTLRARGAAPERIRVAAEAAADDDVRAALEAAAEAEIDDAKLDRAMRRLR